jgi:hypothetical protein
LGRLYARANENVQSQEEENKGGEDKPMRISDSDVQTAKKNWDEVNEEASRFSASEVTAARTLASALVLASVMIARAIENNR